MHKLTRILPIWSTTTIDDGSELSSADSSEMLRKGTMDYRLLEPPLIDSFLQEEIGNEAHLLGHSKDSGMSYSDGAEDRQS
jgi:hypothetical protein